MKYFGSINASLKQSNKEEAKSKKAKKKKRRRVERCQIELHQNEHYFRHSKEFMGPKWSVLSSRTGTESIWKGSVAHLCSFAILKQLIRFISSSTWRSLAMPRFAQKNSEIEYSRFGDGSSYARCIFCALSPNWFGCSSLTTSIDDCFVFSALFFLFLVIFHFAAHDLFFQIFSLLLLLFVFRSATRPPGG